MINLEPSLEHHWEGLVPNPEKHWGFIYLLWDHDDCVGYCGKKQCWFKRPAKKGCKTAVKVPSSPKWKPCCWKESDWRYYNGSSVHWVQHTKDNPEHQYTRRIIALCETPGLLTFSEAHAIMTLRGLIGPYMNRQLPSVKFRPDIKLWESMEVDEFYFIK